MIKIFSIKEIIKLSNKLKNAKKINKKKNIKINFFSIVISSAWGFD